MTIVCRHSEGSEAKRSAIKAATQSAQPTKPVLQSRAIAFESVLRDPSTWLGVRGRSL
jgi:hypothetical protein